MINNEIYKLINSEDKSDRLKGIIEVEKQAFEDIEAIKILISLLSNEYWIIRKKSAESLIKINNKIGIYKTLIDFLGDESEDINYWLTNIIAYISNDEILKYLTSFIDDKHKQRWISDILRKVAEENYEYIIKLYKSTQNPYSKFLYIRALENIKNDEIIDFFKLALNEEYWLIRQAASLFLGNFTREDVIRSLTNLLNDDNWKVRKNAAESLWKITSKLHKDKATVIEQDPHIKELILNSMDSDNLQVKESLSKFLSNLENSEEVETRIIDLIKGDNVDLKIFGLKAFKNIAKEEYFEVIKNELVSAERLVIKNAVFAIAEIPSMKVLDYFIEIAINTKNSDVKLWIAEAIGKNIDKYELNRVLELFSILIEERDEQTRYMLSKQFIKLKDESAFDLVLKLLQDTNYMVRKNAYESLQNFKKEQVVDYIILGLKDENGDVRKISYSLIAKMDLVEGIEYLKQAYEKETNINLKFYILHSLSHFDQISDEFIFTFIENSDKDDEIYLILKVLENKATKAIVPKFQDILQKSKNEDIKFQILNILDLLEEKIDYKLLMSMFEHTENREMKLKILSILSKFSETEVVEKLKNLTLEHDKKIRYNIYLYLGKYESAELLDIFVNGLDDKYWPIRKISAENIIKLGTSVSNSLIEILKNSKNSENKLYWALKSLGNLKVKESYSIFKSYLDHKNVEFVKNSIVGISNLQNSDYDAELIKFLDSSLDEEIIVWTIKSLRNTKSDKVFSRLRELTESKNENISFWANNIHRKSLIK